MLIRPLLKAELILLSLSMLILATFVQIRLPFISFVLPQLPDTQLWVESPWLYVGTFAGSIQIPALFICLMLFDGVLTSLTLGLYLLLGLLGLPIFYHGGGLGYFQQPTFGYLLILLPAAWVWMFTLKRHPRRQPPVQKYLSASLTALLMIHLFGGLYAALYHSLVPLRFVLSFVLPQLFWQIPSVFFIVLSIWQLQRIFAPPKHALAKK